MHNTPNDCSDETINRLFEQLPQFLGGVPLTNAETVVSGRTNELRKSHIIDLQKRYEIVVTELPTLYRLPEFEAVDLRTFDAEPEARFHIKGRGATESAAILDLLEQLAAEVAKG